MERNERAARGAASVRQATACCLIVITTIALAACSSAMRNGGDAPQRLRAARAAQATHSSRTFVVGDDIERAGSGGSVFDAIFRLRPSYLRPTPALGAPTTRQPIVSVFVNDTYAGGPDVLRLISSDAVESVRYLERSEALRFIRLEQQGDGFIMVRLKRFAAAP